MKKFFLLFWALFIAYFIFVHPCIIYYNTPHGSLNTPDGIWALFYLALSILLWGIVVLTFFFVNVKNSFIAKKNIKYITQKGRDLQSVIRASKSIKKYSSGAEIKEIKMDVNNFSGAVVAHTMLVTDSRPEENRFKEGKILYLKVDAQFTKNPYVYIEGAQSKIHYLAFLYWLVFVAALVGYYYYAYTSENCGNGWRFLELFHPLIVIPACIIFFSGLIFGIYRIFIMSNQSNRTSLKLKFWGEVTNGDIIDIKQTGTYINEQPQVKYTLSFTDSKGQLHQVTKKEIVSLMDIGNIGSVKAKTIIYLPENPETFNFLDEISN